MVKISPFYPFFFAQVIFSRNPVFASIFSYFIFICFPCGVFWRSFSNFTPKFEFYDRT